jgi:hypothetical protein
MYLNNVISSAVYIVSMAVLSSLPLNMYHFLMANVIHKSMFRKLARLK